MDQVYLISIRPPGASRRIELDTINILHTSPGDLIEISRLEVSSEEAQLKVDLDYKVRRTQETRTATFSGSTKV